MGRRRGNFAQLGNAVQSLSCYVTRVTLRRKGDGQKVAKVAKDSLQGLGRRVTKVRTVGT